MIIITHLGMTTPFFIKIGSNKILITYHTNRNIFQNHTINENSLNNYHLEFLLNNTSNEYDLQSVYNGNGFLVIISDFSHVYLTMYDTTVSPYTYTGSDNIDITDNQTSLTSPLNINDEVVLNPRAYDGAVFVPGTDNFAFRQNTVHGGQPIAQFFHQRRYVDFMVIVRFQIRIIKHL